MAHLTKRPRAEITSPDCTRPYLIISLDDALFGIEINQVRRISQIGRIWRLPCQPACVKGVTIIGDRIFTLIDLRLKLGLPEIAYDSKTCALEVDGSIPVAVVVDSVERVARFAMREIEKTNSCVRYDSRAVTGIVHHSDRLCLLLDLDWILTGRSTSSCDEQDTPAVRAEEATLRRLDAPSEKTTVELACPDAQKTITASILRSRDEAVVPVVGLTHQRPEITKHHSEPLRLLGRIPAHTQLRTVDAVLVERVVKDLARPITVGARRIARFRPGDPRLGAIAAALLQMPSTLRTKDAALMVATLLNRTPSDYRITHFRYDLAKLRARNLAERIGTSRRYRLTHRSCQTSCSP